MNKKEFFHTFTSTPELLRTLSLVDWEDILFNLKIEQFVVSEIVGSSQYQGYKNIYCSSNLNKNLLFLAYAPVSISFFNLTQQELFWSDPFWIHQDQIYYDITPKKVNIQRPTLLVHDKNQKKPVLTNNQLLSFHTFKNTNPLVVLENWISCSTHWSIFSQQTSTCHFESTLAEKIEKDLDWKNNLIKILYHKKYQHIKEFLTEFLMQSKAFTVNTNVAKQLYVLKEILHNIDEETILLNISTQNKTNKEIIL